MFGMTGCNASRATACINTPAERRSPRPAFQIHRRFHVYERQRHDCESAGLLLLCADTQQMTRRGPSTCPYMIVAVVRNRTMRGIHFEPRRIGLVGADDRADSSSKFRRLFPQCTQACVFQPHEKILME